MSGKRKKRSVELAATLKGTVEEQEPRMRAAIRDAKQAGISNEEILSIVKSVYSAEVNYESAEFKEALEITKLRGGRS